MLDTLLSQLANGVVLGALYVLIALGLSMVFGVLGIVNMSHGVFVALGAHFALSLQQHFGWPAVVAAPFLAALVGIVAERTLVRWTYRREPLASLILTFAIALLIEALIRQVWGPGGQPFQPPEFLAGMISWGPLLTTRYRLAVFIVTIVLLLGWTAMLRTPFGRILRAGSRDGEMVEMLGINLPHLFTAAFALGCLLAGIAGVLAAPLWSVSPGMGAFALMPAFVIVAIGGLGSYAGAVIAGMLVGVVTSLATQFYPQGSAVAMYGLMFIVLLLRPRGLFGERWERFE